MNYKESSSKLNEFNEWFSNLISKAVAKIYEMEYNISFTDYCSMVSYMEKQTSKDLLIINQLSYNPMKGIVKIKYTQKIK